MMAPQQSKWVFAIARLLLFGSLIAGCSQHKAPTLTIASAANLQFVMADLTQAFTAQTAIATETVMSSSGKLTAQIREGAPYDLFLSADMKYPKTLFQQGLTTTPPKIYAYGSLVLWSAVDGIAPSIDVLIDDRIQHIALANPRIAPYGMAAVESLQQAQVYDVVKPKLVYGESISQANQFTLTQSAEMGFTAKSVVRSPQLSGKGSWIEIDPSTYSPIAQGIVILKNSRNQKQNAQQFEDFLFSDQGQAILKNYGYRMVQQ